MLATDSSLCSVYLHFAIHRNFKRYSYLFSCIDNWHTHTDTDTYMETYTHKHAFSFTASNRLSFLKKHSFALLPSISSGTKFSRFRRPRTFLLSVFLSYVHSLWWPLSTQRAKPRAMFYIFSHWLIDTRTTLPFIQTSIISF